MAAGCLALDSPPANTARLEIQMAARAVQRKEIKVIEREPRLIMWFACFGQKQPETFPYPLDLG